MTYLTLRVRDEDGHSSLNITGDRVVIGRDAGCDIRLEGGGVSREHCKLSRTPMALGRLKTSAANMVPASTIKRSLVPCLWWNVR